MQGEDVLGSRIRVLYSSEMEFSSASGNSRPGNSGLWPNNQARNREGMGGQLPSWKPSWKSRTTLFGNVDTITSSHRAFVESTRIGLNTSQPLNNNQEMNIHNVSHNTSGSSHSTASPLDSSREASPHDNNVSLIQCKKFGLKR